MRWAAWGVAGVVAIVHLLTAGRYGLFVNELYFIVCGRHPSFGYVDQPPLVPLIAAATQFGGTHVWLLRLPAVLAATLLVPLTVDFAQLLGASTRGAWLAAIAAACAPMLTAMTATLTTSTFEPLAWTALAYCVTRAVLRGEATFWWLAGAVAGLAFEVRYGVLLWIIALAIGIALTKQRPVFRTRALWIGVGIGALIALPNALWQILHGLPFLEVVRNDSAGNLTGTPLVFTIDQVFSLNFMLAPLWVAGIVAPFASPGFARFRFLAIAFVVSAVLVFATHGKSYYLAGAYPTMFALGAAGCTALPVVVVAIWVALAAANGALALPLVLPVYSPERLKVAVDNMPVKLRPVEVASIGAPLTQVFSYEFRVARTGEDRKRCLRVAPGIGSRARGDLCIQLWRSGRDRRARQQPAARAQRQQPVLPMGPTQLRRLGGHRRKRGSGEVVAMVRFVARRGALRFFAVRDAARTR